MDKPSKRAGALGVAAYCSGLGALIASSAVLFVVAGDTSGMAAWWAESFLTAAWLVVGGGLMVARLHDTSRSRWWALLPAGVLAVASACANWLYWNDSGAGDGYGLVSGVLMIGAVAFYLTFALAVATLPRRSG